MRNVSLLIVLVFALYCCAQNSNAPNPPVAKVANTKLDDYFARYCNYTGNMGIGFVASHTYDFKFRQRLKETQDAELKRLYVLYHLYGDVDSDIDELEKGVVDRGKGKEEKMTPEERERKRASINGMMQDLASFDPGDPEHEIAEYRERLNKIPRSKSATPPARK